MDNPCKGHCINRSEDCHSTYSEYLSFYQKRRDAEEERKKKQQARDLLCDGYFRAKKHRFKQIEIHQRKRR